MAQRKTPNYRRQKRRGSFDQAIVEIDGRRHYLGEFDSPESKQRYHQLVSDWLANPPTRPMIEVATHIQ